MIILTVRTDNPEAEIGLYEDDTKLAYEIWQAHRQLAETIHKKIETLLKAQKKDWKDIEGIVGFKGPGSFTGLRIGLGVANALAAGFNIPIVGAGNKDWQQDGIKLLLKNKDEKQIVPEYGSPVHITKPKH